MASLMSKALADNGRDVQLALYKELQNLFVRLNAWSDDSQDTSNLTELETGLRQESVLELLLREVDTSVEAIRQERAQAILAYVQFCQKKTGGLGVSERLRQSISHWREQERSESVRRVLEKFDGVLVHNHHDK